MRKSNRAVGTAYEKDAVLFLKQSGYEVVETNYRCRIGEIDIIAKEQEYLVFIEVKFRRDSSKGDPLESIDYRKQYKICLAARVYLMEKRLPPDQPCRFDVVSILGDKMKVVKNAFFCEA